MVGYVRQLGSPSIWVFLLIWYIFLSPVCAFETLGQECTLSICYSKTCFVGYSGCRGQIYLKSTSLLQFLQNLTRDQLCINPAKASHRVCQGWSYIPLASSHVVGAFKKKKACSVKSLTLPHPPQHEEKMFTCDVFPRRPLIEGKGDSYFPPSWMFPSSLELI